MTLYKLIDLFKQFSLKHPNINHFEEGSVYEIMNNGNAKYATVVLTQTSHSQDDNYNHYGFNLFYIDRLNDKELNRVQIQSTGKEMLSNIINFICDEFDLEHQTINFQPFTEKFVDYCAGIYCTITIDTMKEYDCAEEYWNEDYVAPIVAIRNEYKTIDITENGTYKVTYDEANFTGLEVVDINVNIPLEEIYQNAYNEGFANGEQTQKDKLQSIEITENGVYQSFDYGFREVNVNVPDLNGDYNEGYSDGYSDAYNEAYQIGVQEGEIIGTETTTTNFVNTAQVLRITKNGTYTTKYSNEIPDEPITPDEPETVTGYWDDGTPFYGYAYTTKVFDTGIPFSDDLELEMWYKPDSNFNDWHTVIGAQINGDIMGSFKFCEESNLNNYKLEYGYGTTLTGLPLKNDWNNIVISKTKGIVINGVKYSEWINDNSLEFSPNIWINASYDNEISYNANGYYGMIKLNGNTIIPIEEGFHNQTTNRYLNVKNEGDYQYGELEHSISTFNLRRTADTKEVTGIFPDGKPFYNYAKLDNIVFDTGVKADFENLVLEFWYKDDNYNDGDNWQTIVGTQESSADYIVKVYRDWWDENTPYIFEYGGLSSEIIDYPIYTTVNDKFRHFKIDVNDGIFLDGERITYTTFSHIFNYDGEIPNFFINATQAEPNRSPDGWFGMIKINNHTFIPTENGFMEYEIERLLGTIEGGNYVYTEVEPIVNDNFIKTVIVDIETQPITLTENGTYTTSSTKIEDYITDEPVTGVFDDGSLFYEYGLLTNTALSTGIYVDESTRLEFWFMPIDGTGYVIGSEIDVDGTTPFKIENHYSTTFYADITTDRIEFVLNKNEWHHIIMSFADGLIVDGEKVGDFANNISGTKGEIFINEIFKSGSIVEPKFNSTAYFGLIKINDEIFVPKEDGFKNYKTGEKLEMLGSNNYSFFTPIDIIELENGNPVRTIKVDVYPKISIAENKIKFAYSNFTELPYYYDFTDVTDCQYMFYMCKSLIKIPKNLKPIQAKQMFEECAFEVFEENTIDTSLITNAEGMFRYCKSLKTVANMNFTNAERTLYLFQNAENLETVGNIYSPKSTDMYRMLTNCKKLKSIGEIYCDSMSNGGDLPLYATNDTDYQYLTDVGGFINLKCKWDSNNGLVRCANLTRQSYINIFSNLYDFVSNGETPTSSQGVLKLHSNYLTVCTQEDIDLAISKGWSLTN